VLVSLELFLHELGVTPEQAAKVVSLSVPLITMIEHGVNLYLWSSREGWHLGGEFLLNAVEGYVLALVVHRQLSQ